MIPNFNISGVLPPFEGNPTTMGSMAPYETTLLELATRFASSPERIKILKGFIAYRTELKSVGIQTGFQWLNGSFVEDVEKTRLRAPNDIDIITFAERPINAPDWDEFVSRRKDLFYPDQTKKQFLCDAYYVDLNLPPATIVDYSRYWFGLFSHQRNTLLWKGLLQIQLQENETEALEYLEQRETNAA